MNVSKSESGKMKQAISLVGGNIDGNLELAKSHRRKVNDIREQGWYRNVEGKGLKRNTIYVEDVQNQIVQYAKNEIKDQKQILALIVKMCYFWESSIEPSSPTYIHAKPLVELLGSISSPYYRGALLIYQATLYERRKSYERPDILLSLPTVSLNKSDEYHAMSVWLKGRAYESINKYIEATDMLSEIGPDDPLSYQVLARTAIAAMKPLAQKQAEDEACVMF